MAKNKQYRKHQTQKGAPMWRDPSHAQPGGCGVVALALVAAPVVVGVVALFN